MHTQRQMHTHINKTHKHIHTCTRTCTHGHWILTHTHTTTKNFEDKADLIKSKQNIYSNFTTKNLHVTTMESQQTQNTQTKPNNVN